MGLTEIVFRTQFDWPLTRIFRQHQSSVGSLWCNNGERDIVEIRADRPADLKSIQKDLISLPNHVAHHFSENDNSLVVITNCTCYEKGVVPVVVLRANCLLMPPTIFHQGWEHYKIVSMSSEMEGKLFRNLRKAGNFEILSKMRILNTGIGGALRISALSLFSRLTDKQLKALLTAHELGYYRSPRNVTTEELSKALGSSRPTSEEHLRKAENKIISSVAQHLKLLYYREVDKSAREELILRRN